MNKRLLLWWANTQNRYAMIFDHLSHKLDVPTTTICKAERQRWKGWRRDVATNGAEYNNKSNK